ncbi:MAG: hypothetical protein WCJ09_07530 [Planctomycetota bacterium]
MGKFILSICFCCLAGLAFIAILAIAPISIPLLIFGFCTETIFIPSEWRFKWQMWSLGRCVSRSELQKRIQASTGTVIIDLPTFSWSITRVWWTSDDVVVLASAKGLSPDEDLPDFNDFKRRAFDSWVWEEYLHSVHGRALLAGVWHANKMVDSILHDSPSFRSVQSCSFSKILEEWGREISDGESVEDA